MQHCASQVAAAVGAHVLRLRLLYFGRTAPCLAAQHTVHSGAQQQEGTIHAECITDAAQQDKGLLGLAQCFAQALHAERMPGSDRT